MKYFFNQLINWRARVRMEFVGRSIGQQGAEAVGLVAQEVGEGVDAGGLHFEVGDVEFTQLCFVEVL